MPPMPPAPPHGWQVLDRIESLRHSILILPLYPKSVADLIKLTKPDSIPDEAAACVAAGVLAAVAGLFLAGYNHNDIKPGNIMLAANQVTLGAAWAGRTGVTWCPYGPYGMTCPWQVMVANGNCLHRRASPWVTVMRAAAMAVALRGAAPWPTSTPVPPASVPAAYQGRQAPDAQSGPRHPERPLARLGPVPSTAAAP